MAAVVLGEMRCSACLKASRYSKIMLRFELGSMAPMGRVKVRCKCGNEEVLSADNHFCDGVRTFRVLDAVSTG